MLPAETSTDETVPDSWWTNGYCSIFAYALNRRFGMPMYAVLEVAKKDRDATLIHAVAVQDGKAYDADGVIDVDAFLAGCEPGGYYPGEESTIEYQRIGVQRLGDIHHDFSPHLLPPAFAFIDEHPERFADLTPRGETCRKKNSRQSSRRS